jgi:septal ring factor EnvC (AmiA/AmiB activator)
LDQLSQHQLDLSSRTQARVLELESQTSLLNEAKAERQIVEREKSSKEKLLTNLKKDTKQLERKLEEQQKERRKLSKAIEKLILAELEKNRKEREERGTLSAESIALTGEFKGNKGRLPWPVTKGVVTAGFGKQSHPDIRGVYMDNTGIDLITDEGGSVKTIFNGTVVGTTKIAGQHNMVVVSHGDYYTVYSKLVTLVVKSGDVLSTGDQIGKTGRSVDGLGNFHFEIWQGKTKVDPEQWIRKK